MLLHIRDEHNILCHQMNWPCELRWSENKIFYESKQFSIFVLKSPIH